MGLLDDIFGGDSGLSEARGMVNQATTEGQSIVSAAAGRARAANSVVLQGIQRTIEEARIFSRMRDPIAAAGRRQALRGRAAAARPTGGIGGPAAMRIGVGDDLAVAAAMSGETSERIQRTQMSIQMVSQLLGMQGEITSAGTNAELAAFSSLAGAKIGAAAELGRALMEAKAQRAASMFSAAGGAIAGIAMGWGEPAEAATP